MPRLKYLDSAKNDLVEIARYLAERSQSADVARGCVAVLRARCRQIAENALTAGRARPELRSDLRSVAEGNYVILFRYADDAVEIVNIIEGHRDIDGMFSDKSDKP